MAKYSKVEYTLSGIIDEWINHSADFYGPQPGDPVDADDIYLKVSYENTTLYVMLDQAWLVINNP